METAFKVFRFVHGYVIIFEFKIFATSKFRALRDFAKKMLRKSGMRLTLSLPASSLYMASSKLVSDSVLRLTKGFD